MLRSQLSNTISSCRSGSVQRGLLLVLAASKLGCAAHYSSTAARLSALRAAPLKDRAYQVFAAPVWEDLAKQLQHKHPRRFQAHPISWGKFPDQTDNIHISGFHPNSCIAGQHVLFLASFHNNDVTLSQFQVMITLLQSFIESLTVVLPFYPVGTMERVVTEGQVATAATYANMFSNLPNCGRPTRLMIYDLHTLQNRFYLHNNAVASLQTAIPLLIERLKSTNIDCVAFPDDGAAKRFAHMFQGLGLSTIVCGKIRQGDRRIVTVQDGEPAGKRIVIVDDLVQSGGTLLECGAALLERGAVEVNAYATHAVFPGSSWKKFKQPNIFSKFWVTNSIPTTARELPSGDTFEVLDLCDKIVQDLDFS